MARRAPKTADGGAAAESASAPAGAKPKARRVRKLTQKVKDGAKTRQVISVDRREREAAALERFVEKKAKALRGGDGANEASGDATREEELSSALRDSGAVNERGESAGDRLRRLFAERRARGLGLVRDKFNDGGAAAAMESFSSGGGTDDQVDHLLDEAASVEEKNRRARDGYMDDTLGSNNSIDPFKLVAGEYVVHRKYGIGQFLGMKVLNVESASGDVQNKPFLFLKYKDTTAKISPDSSRRLLYRYCSPGGLVKPPKLNKLNDKTSWDSREKKTEATIRRLVVNQMVVYLQRLQSMRDPYPSPDAALTKRFEDAFPYTLTPDQCSARRRNHGRFATRFSDGSLGHRRRRFREDGSRHARDVSRRQHGRRRVHDGTDDGVSQATRREPRGAFPSSRDQRRAHHETHRRQEATKGFRRV